MLGAAVGFIMSFFPAGPDPAIMAELFKIEELIKDTQVLVSLDDQQILNAINQLDANGAYRATLDSIIKLKHLVMIHEGTWGATYSFE